MGLWKISKTSCNLWNFQSQNFKLITNWDDSKLPGDSKCTFFTSLCWRKRSQRSLDVLHRKCWSNSIFLSGFQLASLPKLKNLGNSEIFPNGKMFSTACKNPPFYGCKLWHSYYTLHCWNVLRQSAEGDRLAGYYVLKQVVPYRLPGEGLVWLIGSVV